MLETPVVNTSAPAWMEVMLRREENRTYISLYKTMVPYYETCPCDVSLRVQLSAHSGRLIDAMTGEEVPFAITDGTVCWTAKNASDVSLYIWQEI